MGLASPYGANSGLPELPAIRCLAPPMVNPCSYRSVLICLIKITSCVRIRKDQRALIRQCQKSGLELVNASVIRSVMVLASFQKWIDENIVDGIVNGVGKLNRSLGFASAWVTQSKCCA